MNEYVNELMKQSKGLLEIAEETRHQLNEVIAEGLGRNQMPPKNSNWYAFAIKWNMWLIDLDAFAQTLEYHDFYDLDISISPARLFDRNPKKFLAALKDSSDVAKDLKTLTKQDLKEETRQDISERTVKMPKDESKRVLNVHKKKMDDIFDKAAKFFEIDPKDVDYLTHLNDKQKKEFHKLQAQYNPLELKIMGDPKERLKIKHQLKKMGVRNVDKEGSMQYLKDVLAINLTNESINEALKVDHIAVSGTPDSEDWKGVSVVDRGSSVGLSYVDGDPEALYNYKHSIKNKQEGIKIAKAELKNIKSGKKLSDKNWEFGL